MLDAEPHWVTCRHSFVEVHRALTHSLPEKFRPRAVASFRIEWRRFQVVEIDEETCERASELVTTLGVKTLDALHLAAAHRVGGGALPFLTYDLRQAQAARSLGWTVLGA